MASRQLDAAVTAAANRDAWRNQRRWWQWPRLLAMACRVIAACGGSGAGNDGGDMRRNRWGALRYGRISEGGGKGSEKETAEAETELTLAVL